MTDLFCLSSTGFAVKGGIAQYVGNHVFVSIDLTLGNSSEEEEVGVSATPNRQKKHRSKLRDFNNHGATMIEHAHKKSRDLFSEDDDDEIEMIPHQEPVSASGTAHAKGSASGVAVAVLSCVDAVVNRGSVDRTLLRKIGSEFVTGLYGISLFNWTQVTEWPCEQPSMASFVAIVLTVSAESWSMNVSNGMNIAWPLTKKDLPVWMSEKTLYVWLVSRVSCVYSYVRQSTFATTRNASFTNTPGMLILMVPRVSNCLPTSRRYVGRL